MFKIGTFADWFGVGLLDGLKESEKCGASGVQVYAWKDLDPRTASPTFIKEVTAVASGCNQEIVALCGELGGHGLEIAADNPTRVDYLKRVVDLSDQLNCKVITTHIGVIPKETNSATYTALQAACSEVGSYAAQRGAYLAIETGPEPVSRLKEFALHCGKGVAINYDPANLVMVTRDDEVKGVYTAGDLIVHTHAKDGVAREFIEARKAYDLFAEGGIELLSTIDQYFAETPLGEGDVHWPEYLRALKDIGYTGYLTIEREVQKGAAEDIRKAVVFLEIAMAML